MNVDPCDLDGVLALAAGWSEPGRPPCPVPIDTIAIVDDALELAADQVGWRRRHGDTVVVVDDTPITRAGADFKGAVVARLAADGPVRIVRYATPFHADLPAARGLSTQLDGAGLVVAVGSGSVCDVAKYARHLRGEPLPFVCLPTAASVTAYTSALAVLLVDGVKRTLPAAPPEAVIADLRVLAEAPVELTRAGFGDVLARSVAYGDWYLAGQLGMTEGFTSVASRLLEPTETAMIAAAEAVGRREPDAVRLVLEALLLAGLAMSLVNQTSPLSGWEHVISHLLDMAAAAEQREFALHGEQVGAATLLTARAFEQAWPTLDADRLAGPLDADGLRARIAELFGPWDANGALAAEILRDAEAKIALWAESAATRRRFVEGFRAGAFDGFLAGAMRPVGAIEAALRRAGAATRFDDLSVPQPADAVRRAVRWGHMIRRRFTLGDLLAITGWLSDERVAALLGEA